MGVRLNSIAETASLGCGRTPALRSEATTGNLTPLLCATFANSIALSRLVAMGVFRQSRSIRGILAALTFLAWPQPFKFAANSFSVRSQASFASLALYTSSLVSLKNPCEQPW